MLVPTLAHRYRKAELAGRFPKWENVSKADAHSARQACSHSLSVTMVCVASSEKMSFWHVMC